MTTDKKAQLNPAGIVGAVAGFGLSRVLGPTMFIPLVAGVVIVAVLRQVRKRSGKTLSVVDAAVGVVGGHAAWMLAGGVFVGSFDDLLGDLVLMTGVVVALLVFPRPVVFAATIALTLLALYFTIPLLLSAPDSATTKAMIVHTLLRVAAIGLAAASWVSYAMRLKRSTRSNQTSLLSAMRTSNDVATDDGGRSLNAVHRTDTVHQNSLHEKDFSMDCVHMSASGATHQSKLRCSHSISNVFYKFIIWSHCMNFKVVCKTNWPNINSIRTFTSPQLLT